MLTVLKICEAIYQLGGSEAEAEDSALGTIETGTGDSDALVIALGKMFEQGRGGGGDIGIGNVMVDLGLGEKGLEQFLFLFILFEAIEVQEVIEPEAMGAGHKGVDGDIGLEGTTGTEPEYGQAGQVGFDGTGVEIDIDQGIEFIKNDIYIVWANAGGDNRDTFLAKGTGMGDKFAVLALYFDFVKIFADYFDAIGITNREHDRGEFIGMEVEVIDSAAVGNN